MYQAGADQPALTAELGAGAANLKSADPDLEDANSPPVPVAEDTALGDRKALNLPM